jgi:hypothetical protein
MPAPPETKTKIIIQNGAPCLLPVIASGPSDVHYRDVMTVLSDDRHGA